jgi:hypothetical protein
MNLAYSRLHSRHNVRAHRTQITFASQPTIFVRSGAARLLCGGTTYSTIEYRHNLLAIYSSDL